MVPDQSQERPNCIKMAGGDTQVLLPLCEESMWLWTGQRGDDGELSLARDAAGCGLDELRVYRLSDLC